MKKLLLTLGTTLSVLSPIVAVIACGEPVNPIDEYLQIDGQDFIPEEDGVYLMQEYYDGTLMNGSTVLDTEIAEMTEENFVIEMGQDDSIVVVYDDSDLDGFHIDNFENSFAFKHEANPIGDYALEEFVDYNVHAFGNIKVENPGNYRETFLIPFNNGESNKFIGLRGEDSNTTDIEATARSMKENKDVMSTEDYEAHLLFLGLVENEDGTYSDADWIANESYVPRHHTYQNVPAPLFEYEKIAKNAMKVTYVQTNDMAELAGSFGFYTIEEDMIAIWDQRFGVNTNASSSWNEERLAVNMGKDNWIQTIPYENGGLNVSDDRYLLGTKHPSTASVWKIVEGIKALTIDSEYALDEYPHTTDLITNKEDALIELGVNEENWGKINELLEFDDDIELVGISYYNSVSLGIIDGIEVTIKNNVNNIEYSEYIEQFKYSNHDSYYSIDHQIGLITFNSTLPSFTGIANETIAIDDSEAKDYFGIEADEYRKLSSIISENLDYEFYIMFSTINPIFLRIYFIHTSSSVEYIKVVLVNFASTS